MEPQPCVVCGQTATNGHHRKMRSQGGDFSNANIIPLCGSGTTGCHGLVHRNPGAAYAAGLLVHSYEDPADIPVNPELFLDLGADSFLAEKAHDHQIVGAEVQRDGLGQVVPEGEECPTCHRRVPHPKKDTSPVTKVLGVRVPIDDIETFKDQIDAGARHLDCVSKPHWRYWTLLYALVALLQNEEFAGALTEVPS